MSKNVSPKQRQKERRKTIVSEVMMLYCSSERKMPMSMFVVFLRRKMVDADVVML